MAQKGVAEADVAVRAFNQPRHVADREPMKVGILDDADLRMQRGKGIRRNLRSRVRDGLEQGGLAGVRVADQADIGDHAQFEQEIAFLARLARLREARGLSPRRGEVAVAQAAATAFAQHELLTVLGEVGDQFAFRTGDVSELPPSRRVSGSGCAASQTGSRRLRNAPTTATPACRRGL